MLTDKQRKQLRYNLLMDDASPMTVMGLSDDELININAKNQEYVRKLLKEKEKRGAA